MLATDDEKYMLIALGEAAKAAAMHEVPIGACVVNESGEVIATGFNRTIVDSDPTGHAEILAIRQACEAVGNYRLTGFTLYTTIEPCVMCAGAIVNARIARLVFGAHDERFGAVETKFRLCDSPLLNHRLEITSGILAEEGRSQMQNFFRAKR